jgi:hypothetical protein
MAIWYFGCCSTSAGAVHSQLSCVSINWMTDHYYFFSREKHNLLGLPQYPYRHYLAVFGTRLMTMPSTMKGIARSMMKKYSKVLLLAVIIMNQVTINLKASWWRNQTTNVRDIMFRWLLNPQFIKKECTLLITVSVQLLFLFDIQIRALIFLMLLCQ